MRNKAEAVDVVARSVDTEFKIHTDRQKRFVREATKRLRMQYAADNEDDETVCIGESRERTTTRAWRGLVTFSSVLLPLTYPSCFVTQTQNA